MLHGDGAAVPCGEPGASLQLELWLWGWAGILPSLCEQLEQGPTRIEKAYFSFLGIFLGLFK